MPEKEYTNLNSADGKSDAEIRRRNQKYIDEVLQQYRDFAEEEVYGEKEKERQSFFGNIWNKLMGKVK